MSTPPLMSERDDPFSPNGAWRDCAYASAIMLVHKAGKRWWPAGYGVREREALERSDDQPDETGANYRDIQLACHRRYALSLPTVPPDALGRWLAGTAKRGFSVPGRMTNLPPFLRRWDTAFTGAHQVYVEPMGDGLHVRWLDPLATWGFKGDIVPVTTVLAFNAPFAGQALSLKEGDATDYRLAVTKYAVPATYDVKAGTTLAGYSPERPGSAVKTQTFAAPATVTADAEVTVTWPNYQQAPVPKGGPFLRVTTGPFAGLLIVKARVA